jgi:hypothetical protein
LASGPRLPRLERYLAGLPGGLDAHPECLAKGALVRNLLEAEQVAGLLPSLPEPLRRIAADPPVGSEWIPEVQFGGLLLAVADARGLDDAGLRRWVRDRNRALFQSPAYQLLMTVVSPAQLIRFAGGRWGNWHRGSALAVEGIADDGVLAALRFPPGLFDTVLLQVYAEAFTAALELASARSPRVEVLAETPGLARLRASWD